jgi:chromosome segregation ATPase
VRIATEKTPEPLRDSLDNKERKIRELEQLCCELTEGASKLLKTFDGRNTALTRAEEQIRLLDERCAHLEAKANLTNSEETIEKLNSTQRVDRVEPAVLEGDFTKARSRCAGRSRSNNSVRKINKNPEQAVIRPTEGLLDRTISF